MIDLDAIKDSYATTPSKIVLLVVDGLGGLPHPETKRSELEHANIPNLDHLAQESACGLTVPVMPGVAPGSGPGHLALFGYDPLKYLIGRGALEALGIEVDLRRGDISARGNFCTADQEGNLVDRRAGRVPSEVTIPLCRDLDQIQIEGVDLRVYPVEGYRFVLHLRGEGLSDMVTETDPQRTGVSALDVKALSPDGEKTASIVNEFVSQARGILKEEERANMVLLRGFSGLPNLPSMGEAYRLSPAAIAAYPMYRGLSTIVGMKVIPTGRTFSDELDTLYEHYEDHDFFYVHYKPADAAGEDGNFEAKVKALEDLDKHIPRLLELKPDVLAIAGDHATPAIMAAHSWHPVPFLLHSQWTLGEGVESFSERSFSMGPLGRIPATQIMLLALAHSGKLTKFGP
ncbi:MAG: 2,3-bisphosphoglycerate-independent phosphoglycerate mutase [Dehalococcoidia bacterium]|nr:2,3-bisphosphoglycerate-independent phosphoglycerate mutase [Dehalococcoidia bacterium]